MSDLHLRAYTALRAREPAAKCASARALLRDWDANRLSAAPLAPAAKQILEPGRPERPILVSPRSVERRKVSTPEGRGALIHSLAHIEFNAVNLALDALY